MVLVEDCVNCANREILKSDVFKTMDKIYYCKDLKVLSGDGNLKIFPNCPKFEVNPNSKILKDLNPVELDLYVFLRRAGRPVLTLSLPPAHVGAVGKLLKFGLVEIDSAQFKVTRSAGTLTGVKKYKTVKVKD